MDDGGPPKNAGILERMLALLAEPAQTFAQAAENAREARRMLDTHLAEQLAKVLNRQIEGWPQATVQDKRAIAQSLNAELRSVGLAVREPKTGEPSRLHVDPREGGGRFQFEVYGSESRRRPTSSTRLSEVTLCTAPPRREGWREYWRSRRAAQDEHEL